LDGVCRVDVARGKPGCTRDPEEAGKCDHVPAKYSEKAEGSINDTKGPPNFPGGQK
jgi:hypothetical protein